MFKRTRTNTQFGSNIDIVRDTNPVFDKVSIDNLDDGLLYIENTEVKSSSFIDDSRISSVNYNKLTNIPTDMSLNRISLNSLSFNKAPGFLKNVNTEVVVSSTIKDEDIESLSYDKLLDVPVIDERSFDTLIEISLKGYDGHPWAYNSNGQNPQAFIKISHCNSNFYHLEAKFAGPVSNHTRFVLSVKGPNGYFNFDGKHFRFSSSLVHTPLSNGIESNFVLYNHDEASAYQLSGVLLDGNEGFFSLRKGDCTEYTSIKDQFNIRFVVTTHILDYKNSVDYYQTI